MHSILVVVRALTAYLYIPRWFVRVVHRAPRHREQSVAIAYESLPHFYEKIISPIKMLAINKKKYYNACVEYSTRRGIFLKTAKDGK